MTHELRLVGYWRGDQAPGWPDPRRLVDEAWDPAERDQIADLLRHGSVTRAYMGWSSCRLCGQQNGNLELTDGVHVWPDGLAHYVADHSVRLPPEVVVSLQERQEEVEGWPYDLAWWKSV